MDKKQMSAERKKYFKKIRTKKISVILTQIFILITFIASWEILANMSLIDSFITSQPSRIINTFINLSETNLLMHVGVTCFETIVGFLLGTILRNNNSNNIMVV